MTDDPLLYACQGYVDLTPEPKKRIAKMPTPAAAPLRKVTLNLYDEDVQILKRVYGHGWSTHIRDEIHIDAQATKKAYGKRTVKTLEDLANGR